MKISNTVAPPKKKNKAGRPIGGNKYPFADMTKGASFEITKATLNTVRTSAASFVKKNQPTWSFTVGESGGKYYCWRIK